MVARTILLAAIAVLGASPGLAGPCTQQIAELEKATSAKHEGAGPALANPSTTGSTAPAASPGGQSGAPATDQGATQAMQMLQQAKQLDQQGKEAECMDLTRRVGAMAPPSTK